MRYLGQDDLTRVMGVGYLGEVRQGPDGALYQYVQGVDGLGNPFGFWRRLKRWARRVVQKALPIAQQFAPFVPGGTAALTAVTPFLKQAGVAGYDGLGALYEAPDGSLFQVQGLGEAEDFRGIGENEMTQMMGVGYLGEVRQGPDGALYQYVRGVDGLGNPFGFWRRLKRWARRVVQKALPIAKQFATFVPGGTAALTAVTPVLKQAGVAGYDGLGALYQAPDGSVYQMQGISDDDDLRGLDEDEELRGLDEDEELRGFAEDEALQGLNEDEQIQGFADDEELRGFDEDQEMQGIADYIRQDGMSGLERYDSEQGPQTRWHAPRVWKPAW